MVGESEWLRGVNFFSKEVKEELIVTANYEPVEKDILIVVHNQLEYLKICVESIREHTQNYHIFVWDNGSDRDVQNWLAEQEDIVTVRHEENLGFIVPNNELIKLGSSPYVILLNSDTMVLPDWDKALIAHLQQKDNLAQVGFMGGILDDDGKGKWFQFGTEIDYVAGWCFAISRETYNRFGLFDQENLEFAYGEDADFSMRLQENGKSIMSLHLGLVHHFQNKTILQVRHKRDCRKTFEQNHRFIKQKWGNRIGRKLRPNNSLGVSLPDESGLQDGQSVVESGCVSM